ncbi:hypothetical protein [Paraburkholderia sp. MM5384-R2]|uniref:hypothetical protein n=1 Tax=Paraburkholderia sp. MM5384-R2 TaxID=2723097 RepID=UPI001616C340|nr:hypothetical protein [Paraburkholderia sp. MM5384-R2]MBB5496080.1 hypothetical protein [Paraburkholderia sp. MM5384-R2]
MELQKQDEPSAKEECQLCRITYSIYSNFPPMPSAMALNAETGEWFPFDRLKSYSNGYDMAEALGYAWACDCRERKAAPAPQNAEEVLEHYFELVDAKTGIPVEGMTYKLLSNGRMVVEDAPLADGKTRSFPMKNHPNLIVVAWRAGNVR